jgi:hypothetical protein
MLCTTPRDEGSRKILAKCQELDIFRIADGIFAKFSSGSTLATTALALIGRMPFREESTLIDNALPPRQGIDQLRMEKP